MKNFRIMVSRETLQEGVYRVYRSSDAYSFFGCEYRSLAKDSMGNILIPSQDVAKVENKEGLLQHIRDRMTRESESIVVPVNSNERMFFKSEYSCGVAEDIHHNLIVPIEDYPRKGRR